MSDVEELAEAAVFVRKHADAHVLDICAYAFQVLTHAEQHLNDAVGRHMLPELVNIQLADKLNALWAPVVKDGGDLPLKPEWFVPIRRS